MTSPKNFHQMIIKVGAQRGRLSNRMGNWGHGLCFEIEVLPLPLSGLGCLHSEMLSYRSD